MQVVGRVTLEMMRDIRKRGLTPKEAVDALLAETDRRYPNQTCLLLQDPLTGEYEIVVV